jgi:Predicted ATPase
VTNPFDDERLHKARSALVKITPDEQGRYEFNIACQYTREGLNQLQVGDLVAVENYAYSASGHSTYSVLSLTQVIPLHFAAQGHDAYPGHLFESMRSIKTDWEIQKDRPLHATTTIECRAIPTGWQFSYDETLPTLPELTQEVTLPMVGAEIRPLNRQMVDAIINHGMDCASSSPLTHKKFNEIEVKLDNRALLTTHFGIFGFTGVGKSNFVSSLVNSLTLASEEGDTVAQEAILEDRRFINIPNIIIIDPNDEYLALFIDKFVNNPEIIRYIHVGMDSLPSAITSSLLGTDTDITSENVELLYRQIHIPLDLKRQENVRQYISQGIANALLRTSITLSERDLASWIRHEFRRQIPTSAGPATKDALADSENAWTFPFEAHPINNDNVTAAIALESQFGSPVHTPVNQRLQNNQGNFSTANGVIQRTARSLGRLQRIISAIPASAIISIETLIRELNDTTNHSIFIITGRRDFELKQFCTILGNELYESRRTGATGEEIEPYTLLLLDEADLFIPSEVNDEDTKQMKEMCVTIARRGRKFNLGIGLSTQRASMLDTQIMANLHTHFVSRLPRKYDREKVAEAFGVGEEELSPTFTFSAGNWLLISHDATGLKGVPIPTIARDANSRIKIAAEDWISSHSPDSFE